MRFVSFRLTLAFLFKSLLVRSNSSVEETAPETVPETLHAIVSKAEINSCFDNASDDATSSDETSDDAATYSDSNSSDESSTDSSTSDDSGSESGSTDCEQDNNNHESGSNSDTAEITTNLSKVDVEDSKKEEPSNNRTAEVIMSKNEVSSDTIPIPPVSVKITEKDKLQRMGVIHSILEKEIIVRSALRGEDESRHTWSKEEIENASAFNCGTLLCFENRTPLGLVYDTVGPVHAPYYIVRFNSSEEIKAIAEAKLDARVFVVEAHSEIVVGKDVHVKGYDTSNMDDEEYNNGEFSDDEEERAAKKRNKLGPRPRINVGEDDEVRPFKQTRGGTQLRNATDYSGASSGHRGRGGRARGRGRGRGRGSIHTGAYYGGNSVQFAAPPPHVYSAQPPSGVYMGHIAQQMLHARVQQHQMPGPSLPPNVSGYAGGYQHPQPPPGYQHHPQPPPPYQHHPQPSAFQPHPQAPAVYPPQQPGATGYPQSAPGYQHPQHAPAYQHPQPPPGYQHLPHSQPPQPYYHSYYPYR